MRAEILRLDLRGRRRSLIGYTIGIAAYTLVIVALYPAFKDSNSLDKLVTDSPGVAAVFGISGSLTSPVGWTNANLYANFLPLVVLLVTIGYGGAAIAGEEEAGRLDLVVALPLRRRRILLEKVAVMALLATTVCVATFVCMLVGRAFELDLDVWHLAGTTFAVALLGVLFGTVALAIGAATGARGHAIGIAAAVASAAYLLSSLAPVVSWLDPWRVLSPFTWAVGEDQLTNGLGWEHLLALVLCTVAALAVAVWSFDHHDLDG